MGYANYPQKSATIETAKLLHRLGDCTPVYAVAFRTLARCLTVDKAALIESAVQGDKGKVLEVFSSLGFSEYDAGILIESAEKSTDVAAGFLDYLIATETYNLRMSIEEDLASGDVVLNKLDDVYC